MPQESVAPNASWQWDYIDHYRLDDTIIDGFLKKIWGEYMYHVKRKGDQYRFWVPRALEEHEKDALVELRKPNA